MATKNISIHTAIWFDYFTRQLQENNLLSERESQEIKRKIEAQRQQVNTHRRKTPADQCESAGFVLQAHDTCQELKKENLNLKL